MNDNVYRLVQTEKVRNEHSHDLSVLQAISVVLDRHPELRYGESASLMINLCLFLNTESGYIY